MQRREVEEIEERKRIRKGRRRYVQRGEGELEKAEEGERRREKAKEKKKKEKEINKDINDAKRKSKRSEAVKK